MRIRWFAVEDKNENIIFHGLHEECLNFMKDSADWINFIEIQKPDRQTGLIDVLGSAPLIIT